MKEKPLYVVVSYVPMMRGVAGETLPTDDGSIKSLVQAVEDAPSGAALACIWVLADGAPIPVLVYDGVQELVEHLVEWAEGSPTFWFDLYLRKRGDRYALALIPRFQQSVERFKLALRMRQGVEVQKNAEFRFLYKPLHFASASRTTFDGIAHKIGKKMPVYFLDRKDVDPADPGKFDESKLSSIGPFKVHRDGWASSYVDTLIDEAEPPAAPPF